MSLMLKRMLDKMQDIFYEENAHDRLFKKSQKEHLDSTPVAMPVNFRRPESLAEQVARLVGSDLAARQLHAAGVETPEEADDFSDPDDEIHSPFEENFDHLHVNAPKIKTAEESNPPSKKGKKGSVPDPTPSPALHAGESEDEPLGQ